MTTTSLGILAKSEYNSIDAKKDYLKQLIKMRRDKVVAHQDREFRNPLFVPLRGLDEDENDRDYMSGREIRRELRNSVEFEKMFDKFICDREEVDSQFAEFLQATGVGSRDLTSRELEKGLKELRLPRQDGQTEEEYFESCLNHAWSKINQLKTPDFLIDVNIKSQNNEEGKVLSNLNALVETFKAFYKDQIVSLEDSILALAFSLQILNLNYFWKDLRDYMREPENQGLRTIILTAGLQSKSQLIQEALIEVLYDLSFSDFEGRK